MRDLNNQIDSQGAKKDIKFFMYNVQSDAEGFAMTNKIEKTPQIALFANKIIPKNKLWNLSEDKNTNAINDLINRDYIKKENEA